MLPIQHRLTTQEEFDTVKKLGTKIPSNSFFISYLHTDTASPTRFGFIISKRIGIRAVVRNTVARRLRAALRELLPKLSGGYDCVIVANPSIVDKSSNQIKEELSSILNKISLLS